MRHALGLDLPERRIGLSAHDFAQLLGTAEVFLTRSAKLAGAPTVASRFLQRLAAVAGGCAVAGRGRPRRALPHLGRSLDHPRAPPRPVVAPAAAPAPRERARRASRSPRSSTGCAIPTPSTPSTSSSCRSSTGSTSRPAPPIAAVAIHAAIGEFAKTYADRLPDDPLRSCCGIGRIHFAPLDDYPEARAFWWPRYERIAAWFADFERQRRTRVASAQVEVPGELAIPIGDRIFRLTGRADRIERLSDGGYAILDFKTGAPPSDRQVQIGVAPQLTLEAAMLRGGGFRAITGRARSIAELVYVRLKGGEPPATSIRRFRGRRHPDAAADAALARLTDAGDAL